MTPQAIGITPTWDEGCITNLDGSGLAVRFRRGNFQGLVSYTGIKSPTEAQQAACLRAALAALSTIPWKQA